MRQNVTPNAAGPGLGYPEADDASLAHDLELVAKKIADVTRKAARDLDAPLAAASAEQERTAGMLAETLGAMTRRLDEIERKIAETQQPSMEAALRAVGRTET